MICCSGKHITQTYTGEPVLNHISFEINDHDRIGITGRNGSGKTTLLNILAGKETPSSGDIHWKKGTEKGYLAQLPDYEEGMTVRAVLETAFADLIAMEKDMLALEAEMAQESSEQALTKLAEAYSEKQEQFALKRGYEMNSQIDKVGNGLNIHRMAYQPFQSLSGGEKTKVCLGVLLLKKPDLLLLDEPTNHLDLSAVEWLGEFLRTFEGTVVTVSHDRAFLDETATKIFDLEEGDLTVYHTDFSGFVKEKEKRLLEEFHKYEEQQKKIKKMREAIKRLKEWANRANPPNEGLHKRARNMERALERMEKLDRPVLDKKRMALDIQSAGRSGNDVVMMTEASKGFNGNMLFKDASMQLRYQDRTVIIGDNGTGKSTLLKMLLGDIPADTGEVRIGSQVKPGYLAQHVYDGQEAEKTVLETFREHVHVTEGEARHILARFLFYGYAVFRKTGQLSGGERMRLRLAQLMYQDVNLLVLDEPTNHLDIESREVLEDVLEDFKGTILAVSHDRYFINKLFRHVYWMNQRKLHFFQGNYEWAKKKMAEITAYSEAAVRTSEKKRVQTPPPAGKNQLSAEKLEEALLDLEEKIYKLENKLYRESDTENLQQLLAEKDELETDRELLYEELDSVTK